MTAQPKITVLIPCRNEEKFIGSCLKSIIANDYPKDKLEIFVIDGMSQDGTRKTIKKYAQEYAFITLLDNPKSITPVALNLGIERAKSDLILWMSAHNTYEKKYISNCVQYLSKFNADAVGGIIKMHPRENSFIGQSICLVSSHPFGVGNSAHKTGVKKTKWADTAFGICYRKEVFEKIGFFNEKLTRGQDMEFSLRMKKEGLRILLAPDIVSHYYLRSDFKSFCTHTFKNGLWAILPLKFTSVLPVSLRHLIPLVFISSLVLLAILSIFSALIFWPFLFLFGLYALINIYYSVRITIKEKDLKYFFLLPLIFFTLHSAYGLGSLIGIFRLAFSRQFWKKLFMAKNQSHI
jgi:glycosyltransferase involved in cell wall biosynthesis